MITQTLIEAGLMKRLLLILIGLLFPLQFTQAAPDYTNHLGIEFKIIEAGYFYMGSCPRRSQTSVCPSHSREDLDTTTYELPQHKVKIKKSFEISIYEITLEQFLPFIEVQRPELLTEEFKACNAPDRPIVQVSWDDVQEYINWLNHTKPEDDRGEYRLPTEAEWEYAARGGSQTIYWWGNEMRQDKTNCHDCDSQWEQDQPSPVGYFTPNPFGLYDVTGNVSEWVEDCWNRNYVSAPIDGSAWLTGNCLARVVRGGAWDDPPWLTRIAVRDWEMKEYHDATIGFRLVREVNYHPNRSYSALF